MEKKLSTAAFVRRSFKAGPPRRKDLFIAPARAVVEAWALCDEIKAMMRRVGLTREDAQAALVLLTGDREDERREKIYVYPVPDMAGLPALYEKAMALGVGEEPYVFPNVWPLGVVFKQFDRQSDTPEVPEVWSHPWLVFPNASRALLAVEQRYADMGPGEEILFHQAK